jgi:CrcB protein
MKIILLVGTGGFVGSISRYLVSQLMQKTFETTFPLGTLVVNIVGSFLIGIIYALSEQSEILSAEWRVFLAVGFCGGFTTFSSFAYENFAMANIQQFLFSALYIGLSLILGLLAVYLGVQLMKL